MNWKDKIAAIIQRNLAWSPISAAIKEQVIAEEIERMENPPAPEESKPEDDNEPLVRGEKLSALRKRARAWAGWES